jgi:hypothetical protein
MRYEKPEPIGRKEALDAVASGNPEIVGDAIIRLALNDPDGHWVEEVALTLMGSDDPNVRAVAATASGHVARIQGEITAGLVIPALKRLLKDPRTAGRAEDALSDIAIFVPAADADS